MKNIQKMGKIENKKIIGIHLKGINVHKIIR
jgi:hypothetical protein